MRLGVPDAVEPDLAHQQRPIAGDVLKPSHVGVEGVGRFEVDVEANQVEKRQLQVLGGWIVGVGDQSVGIDGLDRGCTFGSR